MPSNSNYIADSLVEAIKKGYFQQVRFLIELGHAVNQRDDQRRTPLMLCCMVQDVSWGLGLAQTLLEKDGRVGLKDMNGRNALHYATLYQRSEIVDRFLTAVDYDLNRGDKNGNTALFYAANNGNFEIVEKMATALLKFKMTLDRGNREGVTPLMQAWRRNHLEVADYLVERGADEAMTDKFGKSCNRYRIEALQRKKFREQQLHDKKLRSKMRYDDVSGWMEHQERIRSAPLVQFKGWKEAENERQRERLTELCLEPLIATAHPCDLRNDPEQVFKTTPAQFYDKLQVRRHEGTLHSRPQTAKTAKTADSRPTTANTRPTSAVSAKSAVSTKRPSSAQPFKGWRGTVPKFFGDLEVQYTTSYLPASKSAPPEEAATLSHYDSSGLFIRGDFQGHPAGDIGNLLARHLRKQSAASTPSVKMSPKDNLIKKGDRRSRKQILSSQSSSTLTAPTKGVTRDPSIPEDDVFGVNAALGTFSALAGGGKKTKRSTSSLSSNNSSGGRPISRAAHNTLMTRESPSPSLG